MPVAFHVTNVREELGISTKELSSRLLHKMLLKGLGAIWRLSHNRNKMTMHSRQ